MTLLAVLVFVVAPANTGILAGRYQGYLISAILAGLLLSWLGVLIVALWRPSKAKMARRERARLEAEPEARRQMAAVGQP